MGPFDFYAACMAGGALSCGITHAILTPLDLLKCNIQANPSRYRNTCRGFHKLVQSHGIAGLFKGWIPTLVGYGLQGTLKFGFYEFLKLWFSQHREEEDARAKTLVCLAASASSEFIADIALCPFECLKVRVQTHPQMSLGFLDALSEIVANEGVQGLFKGLVPLWGRQIPYTMVKFACFESTREILYKQIVRMPKESSSRAVQLGVSFAAGYIAGMSCALASHPADNILSLLNNPCYSSLPSARDAIMKVGLIGLFTRGLPLRILMVGTQTGAQWALYDAFKVHASLPSAPSTHITQ